MRASIWRLSSLITLWSVVYAEDGIEPLSGTCTGLLSLVYTWGSCLSYPMDCVCATTDYVESVVGCVNQLLEGETDVDEKRQAAFEGIIFNCPNVTMDALEAYNANSSALQPLGCVSVKDHLCSPDRAFMVTPGELKTAYRAYIWSYIKADRTVWRYGAACIAFWGGICLIRALIYWGFKLFPKTAQEKLGTLRIVTLTRRYLTLPPMLARYHAEPFKVLGFTFNLPTREHSIIVTMFVGLSMGLTFGYKMVNPTYIFAYINSESYTYYIGFISGYLALYLLPLMILFAGRNNFLLWFTGWSQETFVIFHKWVGRIIIIEVIIHTVVYTIYYVEVHYWTISWTETYWNWGVVALVFACLILVQAMHFFRKAGYELFLIIHIISAVFFIIGSYYHVVLLEAYIQYIWAAAAVWSFERAVRIARILIANPFAKALIESHDDAVLEYTITYSKAWKFSPGQHVFIHLITPTFFWESHPFSVTAPVKPEEDGTLKLFVRAKDGATRKTLKRAIAKGGAFSSYVWIDGPYGHRDNVESYSESVFIAGGLGITAVFAYIQGLISSGSTAPISLYWAVSTEGPLTWFKDQIDYMVAHNVNVHINIKGDASNTKSSYDAAANDIGTTSTVSSSDPSEGDAEKTKTKTETKVDSAYRGDESLKQACISYGRLQVAPVIAEHISQSHGSLVVLSCGPGSMNDDARGAVVDGLTTTKNYVEYLEESYTW